MFLCQLHQRCSQPPMRMGTETPIWRAGAHAEENCAAAAEAGLPSASTASATWLARIRDYDAALRLHLWLGHPVVVYVNEPGVGSSAQEDGSWLRAMQKATIEQTTALGSARRGVRMNMAPRRRGAFFFGGRGSRPAAWFGARGQGWAFGGGLNVLHSSGVFGRTPTTNKTPASNYCISKVGVKEACVNRGERPPPRGNLHRIRFLAPIIRFWAPAGSFKYPTEHDGN